MIRSLIFKEWLKTRWILLTILSLFILVLLKISLTIAYEIRFYEANNYLYNVVFRNYIFFSWLLYIPALSGLILAITQFYPEINEKRLKLTLHLPMKENSILMSMIGYGLCSLLLIYIFANIVLWFICSEFFPIEVGLAALNTVYPIYLAGFIAYMASTAIFIEPRWLQRIIMIIISSGFISNLLYLRGFSQFSQVNFSITILTLIFIIFSIYATTRFRRGVM